MGNQKKKSRSDDSGSFEAPRVLRDPASRKVKLGSKVVLRVQATGRPLPEYQWFHNGNKIEGAESDQFEIEKVRRLSGGSYHCEVKNFVGKAQTRACTIAVLTQEIPAIVIEPREAILEEGKPCTLRVVSPGPEVLRGLPIYWTLNGARIPGARGTELPIASASAENQGEYKAMISIGSALESSNVARLEIKSAAAAGEADFLTQGSLLLSGMNVESGSSWDVFDPGEEAVAPAAQEPELLSEMGTQALVNELQMIEEMPDLLGSAPVEEEVASVLPMNPALQKKKIFLENFLAAWQRHCGKKTAKAA